MIPKKIQALFDFIDYLDKNKSDYIEKYIPLCNELKILREKREKLKPENNYKDKQKHEKIQAQIIEKFSFITSNIYNPITNKLRELGIWNGDDIFSSILNNNSSSIYDFKENFEPEDVSQIMKYKQKYLSFRRETNTDFLSLTFVFTNLDEVLKELFDFFKDSDKNEFDSFETKTIEVNNIEEAAQGLTENKWENVKFSIPNTEHKTSGEKQVKRRNIIINNEVTMGDKIQVGDIPNNTGQISIGKENVTKNNDSNELAQKSFNWQKWSIIITIVLALIRIVFELSKN